MFRMVNLSSLSTISHFFFPQKFPKYEMNRTEIISAEQFKKKKKKQHSNYDLVEKVQNNKIPVKTQLTTTAKKLNESEIGENSKMRGAIC